MAERNTSVLFLTKYGRKGASSRYRSLQYIPHLEERGIDCEVSSLFSDAYLRRLYEEGKRPLGSVVSSYLGRITSMIEARAHDVVVVEKELLPYVPAWFERVLLPSGTPYILDLDDAIFHNYDRSGRPLVQRFLGDKIATLMAGSDLVVAGNRYIADYARDAGAQRVEILPTVLDINKYPFPVERPDDPFTIGWIGSPTTAPYLDRIKGPLAQFCEETGAKLRLIGSGGKGPEGVPTEHRTWSEETEVEDLKDAHVGVMPLSDSPWARGKCGFKLIQYMALGMPTIASPVGANAHIVQDGETGLHATEDKSWLEALRRLEEDSGLRRSMGERGRERVEKNYALQVTAPKLATLLEERAEAA